MKNNSFEEENENNLNRNIILSKHNVLNFIHFE